MKNTLGEKRKDRGWTQKYVAKQIGVSPEAICMLETGQRKPSYDVLIKLEDLFEMGHRDLFGAATPKEDRGNDTSKE